MRKLIVTALVTVVFGTTVFAQKSEVNSDKWMLKFDFGATKFNNTATTHVGDFVNVGIGLEAIRTFENNVFVSAGATISVLKKTSLWENPLEYRSFNADVGYRFSREHIVQPYVSVGASYITKANTLPNAEGTFSVNFTGGLLLWIHDSNFGINLQNTYKTVSNENMVPHNRFTLGVTYRL